ncbi:hypothetical protein N9873_04190 [Akkermansiaceae bacterium]|nr:hypothetical protein [bacterium]MDA7935306.1 hypothetical protein [Akkermansiaceae bacterium]MDA8992063.1 hypothetical protein [Akkermansiaceae bacterium]MDB4142137.1 hypothetical protein [Akkermansiaceae bacterium]MDB4257722.1 hypothetical protein [bacterium]
MFEFTIFRIPVRVEPWFWLTGFLLGRGLDARGSDQYLMVFMWMVIVFVSILIHELGHALTSRKLTNVQPNIRLWAMGGLAYPNIHLNRKDSLKVTLAGPAAGLLFFVVICLALVGIYGLTGMADIVIWNITHQPNLLPGKGIAILNMDPVARELVRSLIFINFWWSFVNLLPVYPLDGGQAYAAIEKSQKKVYQVGLITGIVTALVGFFHFGQLYVALLFGFLAFQNFQRLQQNGGWR